MTDPEPHNIIDVTPSGLPEGRNVGGCTVIQRDADGRMVSWSDVRVSDPQKMNRRLESERELDDERKRQAMTEEPQQQSGTIPVPPDTQYRRTALPEHWRRCSYGEGFPWHGVDWQICSVSKKAIRVRPALPEIPMPDIADGSLLKLDEQLFSASRETSRDVTLVPVVEVEKPGRRR